MRTKIYSFIGAVTAALVVFAGPARAQDPVQLRIDVQGVSALADLSASITPEDILADPNVRAVIQDNRWVIKLRPAHSYLTDVTIGLADQSRAIPKPPLRLALPYGTAGTSAIEITIPNIVEPDAQQVLAAYRGEIPSESERDRLVDFLHASFLIDYLVEDHSVGTVPITPPLMRSLVVYATRLDQLLSSSRWFGIPTNVNERAQMIRRSIATASGDPLLSNNIRMTSLRKAYNDLQRAEALIHIRAWRALHQRPLDFCIDDLPIYESFYTHLRDMNPETYETIVVEGKFPMRTHALLRSVECFRQVVTINQDNTRSVYPVIIAGPLGGRTLTEIATVFRRELERELRSYQATDHANAPVPLTCTTGASGAEAQLCQAVGYINDLRPLIINEVSQ